MSLARKNSFIKLKPLPPKGTIAVTSPASPPDKTKVQKGVAYLEKLGYRVTVGKTCFTKDGYLAGSDLFRANELMSFFEDPNIDAIFCARGGFGSMGLLPLLNYENIKKSRKLFVGFSDITALQWAIYAKTSLPTLSAGMVATDMAENPVDKDFESNFWEFLENGELNVELPNESKTIKEISGISLPGTLSVASKLSGTIYSPKISNGILILEDVHEHRHKIDGFLQHFKLAGLFGNCKAILLGQFIPADEEKEDTDLPSLQDIYDRIFADMNIPIISGLFYGHIRNKLALPVGVPLILKSGHKSYLRTKENIFES